MRQAGFYSTLAEAACDLRVYTWQVSVWYRWRGVCGSSERR